MKITFASDFGIGKVGALNNSRTNFYKSTPIYDTVSFSGNVETHKIKVDEDTAKFVANSLSTSTSGHRAKYGSKEFNPEVVKLMTLGVAQYAKDKAMLSGERPTVLIGGDTRKATKESLPLIKETLTEQGVDVIYIKEPVPTPLHALMTKDKNIEASILLTASHNPWSDGGFNLVTNEGAIAPPSVTKKVAANMIEIAKKGKYTTDKTRQGNVIETYPYELYRDTLNSYGLIDWDKIKDSEISIYYDGLKGTGDNVLPKLLLEYGIPLATVISGKKEGPNPTDENLKEVKECIEKDFSEMKVGLANDGDADRFGVVDENGKFITPNDVILLVAHHLANNKGLSGDIIRSQATSSQLDLFAKNNGINVIQTPVGFKYIGEDIIDMRKEGKDILVAGEESGGLTINGHIPEKDGIIALLLILDLMATEKKPISEILEQVKKDLNTEFRADSFSKKLEKEEDKAAIMQRMQDIYKSALNGNTKFGNFEIDVERTKANTQSMEHYKQGGDGVKLYFTDGSSVLVRKSGTEPKVKAYIETYNDLGTIANNNVLELRSQLEKVFDITTPMNIEETKPVQVMLPKINLSAYKEDAAAAVSDISARAGQKGQFLNWIKELPKTQLENIDSIYDLAKEAKEDGSTDIAILGIGGSRHTTEAMMKMLGKDAHVHFYSSVDPESFKRFAEGLDLDKTKFLVVSKSGGTLETTRAYEDAKKLMQQHTGKEDVSDKFIAMTDVSSEKSNLRKAVDRGEIKASGLVHDDVGGRFSIFDDATLFTMAYAGVPKVDAIKMLKASLNAQEEFLNPKIEENEALQLAAFNVNSKNNGKSRHYVEYFSDAYTGTTLWDKQLNNESLKAQISTETNVGPGYLHYNAEADLDEANTDSYYTFVYPTPQDKTTNAVIKGVTTAYSTQHPVCQIEMKDFSPESIARFIELKHFETLYTGNMLRRQKQNVTPKTEALPEVLQPNVEKYKKEVKANL